MPRLDYIPSHWAPELGVRVAELWSRRAWRLRMIREGRWQHPKCMGAARRVYFAPAFEGGA